MTEYTMSMTPEFTQRLIENLKHPRVQIIHHRDPDSECGLEVFIDGHRLIGQVEIEDIDPGRGYEADDIQERRDEALTNAAKADATDFDRAVAAALVEARFERFAL